MSAICLFVIPLTAQASTSFSLALSSAEAPAPAAVGPWAAGEPAVAAALRSSRLTAGMNSLFSTAQWVLRSSSQV